MVKRPKKKTKRKRTHKHAKKSGIKDSFHDVINTAMDIDKKWLKEK